jgi:hypothetical protein
MEKQKFDILFEEIQNNLMSDYEEDIPQNICEICKMEITDTPFSYDNFNDTEYTHICIGCVSELYDKNKDAVDAGDIEIHTPQTKYNNWRKCDSCDELYPDNELKDTSAGMICDWCVDGLSSHGEHISINY